MTHSLAILFLVRLAVSASGSPPPLFAFEADSLKATLTRIGGPAESDSTGPADWRFACDSAGSAAGPAAWFQVEVVDKRSGATLLFPADQTALRHGLRQACRDGGGASPERIAAALRSLASRLRVRMGGPESESGK